MVAKNYEFIIYGLLELFFFQICAIKLAEIGLFSFEMFGRVLLELTLFELERRNLGIRKHVFKKAKSLFFNFQENTDP